MKSHINTWYEVFTYLLAASVLGIFAAWMKASNGLILAGVIVTLLIAIVWLVIIHRKDANSAEQG